VPAGDCTKGLVGSRKNKRMGWGIYSLVVKKGWYRGGVPEWTVSKGGKNVFQRGVLNNKGKDTET